MQICLGFTIKLKLMRENMTSLLHLQSQATPYWAIQIGQSTNQPLARAALEIALMEMTVSASTPLRFSSFLSKLSDAFCSYQVFHEFSHGRTGSLPFDSFLVQALLTATEVPLDGQQHPPSLCRWTLPCSQLHFD